MFSKVNAFSGLLHDALKIRALCVYSNSLFARWDPVTGPVDWSRTTADNQRLYTARYSTQLSGFACVSHLLFVVCLPQSFLM